MNLRTTLLASLAAGIWMVPAYIAIAVMIYFILFFKEKKEIQAAA